MVFTNYEVYGLRPVDFTWPISAKFGEDRSFLARKLGLKSTFHKGIDFATQVGTEIRAYLNGTVQLAGETEGYGYRIWIYHDLPERANAIRSCYAHLSKINVIESQKVKQGEIIGLTGGMPGSLGAGSSTGPHLHFETRILPQDEPFEPKFYEREV